MKTANKEITAVSLVQAALEKKAHKFQETPQHLYFLE